MSLQKNILEAPAEGNDAAAGAGRGGCEGRWAGRWAWHLWAAELRRLHWRLCPGARKGLSGRG